MGGSISELSLVVDPAAGASAPIVGGKRPADVWRGRRSVARHIQRRGVVLWVCVLHKPCQHQLLPLSAFKTDILERFCVHFWR